MDLVERKRLFHLAAFAIAVVAAIVVLVAVDQDALAVIVGLAGIVLIGVAIPVIAVHRDERNL